MDNARSAFSLAKSAVSDGDDAGRGSALGRTIGGIKGLVKAGRYEKLHENLATAVSQIKVAVSALDVQALESMEAEWAARHSEALAGGSAEDAKTASEQLDALLSIRKLLEGQGAELSERILDRESITNNEASELLTYLKEMTSKVSVLDNEARISTAAALDAFSEAVADERLPEQYRREVVSSVADAVAQSDLFRGGEAAQKLTMLAESGGSLSEASEALVAMREKLDLAEMVHELSRSAAHEDMSESATAETLTSILSTMRRMDGFAEEQVVLSRILREEAYKDEDRKKEVEEALTRISDRTVEAKTLLTLEQLNEKFDDAVLDQEELTEALKEGGLAEELLENAAELTGRAKGSDLFKDMSSLALMTMPLPGFLENLRIPLLMANESGMIGGAASWLTGLVGAGGLGAWLRTKLTNRKGGQKPPSNKPAAPPKATPKAGSGFLKSLSGMLRGMGGKGKLIAGLIGGTAAAGATTAAFGDDGVADAPEAGASEIGGMGDAVPVRVVGGTSGPVEGQPTQRQAATVDVAPEGGGTPLAPVALAGGVGALAVSGAASAVMRRMPPAAQASQVDAQASRGAGGTVAAGAKPRVRAAAKLAEASNKPAAPPKATPKAGSVTAAKGGSSVLGTAKKWGGRLISPALTVYDYASADSDEERTRALGGGAGGWAGAKAGALVGGALGSVVPVLGTAAGATVGGLLGGVGGYFLGGDLAADWFTDAEDSIPDQVRSAGPESEIEHIRSMLAGRDLSSGDREALNGRLAELAATVDVAPEGGSLTRRGRRGQDSVSAVADAATKPGVQGLRTRGDAGVQGLRTRGDAGVQGLRTRGDAGVQGLRTRGLASTMTVDAVADAPFVTDTNMAPAMNVESMRSMAALGPPVPQTIESMGGSRSTGGQGRSRPTKAPRVQVGKGAQAPSVAGDDYGIALVNSMLFS